MSKFIPDTTPRGGVGELLPQIFIINSSGIPGQMEQVVEQQLGLSTTLCSSQIPFSHLSNVPISPQLTWVKLVYE